MAILTSGRAGGRGANEGEVGRIVRRRSLMGLRKARLRDFGGLETTVNRVYKQTARLPPPTQSVAPGEYVWLKSCSG